MAEFKIKPTKDLLVLIAIYGGLRSAALAWGVNYRTLLRFVKEGKGIAGGTIAQLQDRTGLSYDRLFMTETPRKANDRKTRRPHCR